MKKKMLVSAMALFMGVGLTTAVIANEEAQTNDVVLIQEEVTYSEVQESELPQAVTASLNEGYADYKVEKALLGSDGTYKVKLNQGDENIAVFFDASGQFSKVETVDKDKEGKDRDRSGTQGTQVDPADPMKDPR